MPAHHWIFLASYGTTRTDMVADDNDIDVGIDLFYKPDSSKQLSVAINPDFGQIESDLLATSEQYNDFSFANTALQIRYRYELAPLSNIYVVYSRGGNHFFEDDRELTQLFRPSWNSRDADNFLVKVRYQF